MRELGFPAELTFAAYHQVFQELLDPGGVFARNTSGVNVALVRFDDWGAAQAAEFVDAVRAAAGRTAVPLLVVLCPGAIQLDDEVRHGIAGLPSVYLLTAEEIAALYPVAEVFDPHGNELGRVPYTPLYFVASRPPWRARSTPSPLPSSKPSPSIATTPSGPASAARMVPKA